MTIFNIAEINNIMNENVKTLIVFICEMINAFNINN